MSDAPAPSPEKKRAFDTYELLVTSTEEITPKNRHIRFDLQGGKTLHFKAGQFAQIFVPHDGKIRRTSYSIASSPQHTDYFELCVTLVDGGVSSTFLHKLRPGDKVQAMAPLGTFTLKDETRDMVFISTGSGVAPFRSMIQDQLAKGTRKNLYLIYGHRYEPDLLYRAEWEATMKSHSNFKVLFTLSRDTAWKGERGYVQEKIEKFVPGVKEKNYFICGLNNMITAVNDRLLTLGVPKEQIHFERYD